MQNTLCNQLPRQLRCRGRWAQREALFSHYGSQYGIIHYMNHCGSQYGIYLLYLMLVETRP